MTRPELPDILHKKRLSRGDVLLTLMCVEADQPKNVHVLKEMGRHAGFPDIQKWNVSNILGRSQGLAIRQPDGWIITGTGRDHLRSLGILPDSKAPRIVNCSASLRREATRIKDNDTAAFVEEAIKCFEAGLHRSCVVLSWVGVMSLLYEYVIKGHLSAFNCEALKKDAKWKNARTKDDLGRMKEADFLDIIASPPLSIVGKNVKQELKNNCLQLRNACGHPSSLSIGENKVAAHLEILILNVFAKFV